MSFPWIGRLDVINLSFLPQISLQIQHNLNENPNGMMYENWQDDIKICLEE